MPSDTFEQGILSAVLQAQCLAHGLSGQGSPCKQEIVETNWKLYKRVNDDDAFARVLVDWVYDRFRKEVE